jgi:hypothetical protein
MKRTMKMIAAMVMDEAAICTGGKRWRMARETLLVGGWRGEWADGRWGAWDSRSEAAGADGVNVLAGVCIDGRAGIAAVVNGRFVDRHLEGYKSFGGIETQRLTRAVDGGKRLLRHDGKISPVAMVTPIMVRCLLSEMSGRALPRKERPFHPAFG